MPPRYLERMQRQSDVLRDVFGDPQNDPPPYPLTPSSAGSSSSSFQYRRSADLSAYQNRYSRDSSSAASAFHRRQDSTLSTQSTHSAQTSATSLLSGSLHYRQSADAGNEAGTSYHFPPPPGYTPTREGFDISALPRESLILVTGASSYQALHIVDQLLQQGFRVRGTVRDGEKAVWTAKLFRDRYGAGRYTTAVIPDMASKHAFDLAVRGCSGVVHVASVTTPSANPHDVITPSIAGALNALEAAGKEGGVRRVVVTSCASAAVSHDRAVRNVVGGDSWNMIDFEDAWAPPPYGEGRVAAVRASSKMQAEQAVWRWYWETRPNFVLNTVLPDTLWGAPLFPQHQTEHLPPSIDLLSSLLHGFPSPTAPICGHFVNVSDSASLHLAALILPGVRNERIFAVSIPWTRRLVRQTLGRLFPERMQGLGNEGKEEAESEEESMDLTVFKDVERAEGLLVRMGRQGWRDLEGSLRGCGEGFL